MRVIKKERVECERDTDGDEWRQMAERPAEVCLGLRWVSGGCGPDVGSSRK